MKTLFYITIKVTRPYGTTDDEKIRQDYKEVFARVLQATLKDELDTLDITGLSVEVKVK